MIGECDVITGGQKPVQLFPYMYLWRIIAMHSEMKTLHQLRTQIYTDMQIYMKSYKVKGVI